MARGPHRPSSASRGTGRVASLAACALAAAVLLAPVRAGGDAPVPDAKYMFEREPGRRALVIGNADYVTLQPMPSARFDAEQMALRLGNLGFTVTPVPGIATYGQFDNGVLPAFRGTIQPGDLVVVYFSGHGFGYGQESYLAPGDLTIPVDERELFKRAIAVSVVEDYFSAYGPGFLLIVVDACRTIGDFVVRDRRSRDAITKGFRSQLRGNPLNVVVVYATRPGDPAGGFGAVGKMSTFTGAFTDHLGDAGAELAAMFRRVRDQVVQSTSLQAPVLDYSTSSELYLNPTPTVLAQQKEAWIAALTSANPRGEIERYLRMYAVSRHTAAARQWLEDNAERAGIAGYTLASPAAVERAWDRGERVAVVRTGGAFAFARTLDSGATAASERLSDDALGVVRSQHDPATQAFALGVPTHDNLQALGELVTLKKMVARKGPSRSSDVAFDVPAGTKVRLEAINALRDDAPWVLASFDGADGSVYLPLAASAKRLKPIELGSPLTEVQVPPTPGGIGSLADERPLRTAIEDLRRAKKTITWVSLATGHTDDPREADRRAGRLTHVEYLLKRASVDGKVMTSVRGTDGVAGDGVRVRLFGH